MRRLEKLKSRVRTQNLIVRASASSARRGSILNRGACGFLTESYAIADPIGGAIADLTENLEYVKSAMS